MSDLQDLAEDYVLGLLDGGGAAEVARRLAEARTAEDRALAREVGSVRDRVLPLDLTAPELPLRPGAWDRLESALEPQEAPDRAPAAAPASPRAPWRFAALASMAAAVLLAVALGWQVLRSQAADVLVVLLDQGGAPVALLEAYADNSVLVTPLTGVEPGPSQVLQLWTKPDPAGPPVSLGLLEAAAQLVARNPALPEPTPGQLYEITIEPEGGSPTGLPTGPIVGVGNAQAPVVD